MVGRLDHHGVFLRQLIIHLREILHHVAQHPEVNADRIGIGALIVNLFIGVIPYQYAIPAFFAIQLLMAVTIGLIESFMARFRMSHNPQFIVVLTSVSLLIFFGVLLILQKFI